MGEGKRGKSRTTAKHAHSVDRIPVARGPDAAAQRQRVHGARRPVVIRALPSRPVRYRCRRRRHRAPARRGRAHGAQAPRREAAGHAEGAAAPQHRALAERGAVPHGARGVDGALRVGAAARQRHVELDEARARLEAQAARRLARARVVRVRAIAVGEVQEQQPLARGRGPVHGVAGHGAAVGEGGGGGGLGGFRGGGLGGGGAHGGWLWSCRGREVRGPQGWWQDGGLDRVLTGKVIAQRLDLAILQFAPDLDISWPL